MGLIAFLKKLTTPKEKVYSDNLDPCPFCEAQKAYVEEVSYQYIYSELEFQHVFCGNCGCMGPRGDNVAEAEIRWDERESKTRKGTNRYKKFTLLTCPFCDSYETVISGGGKKTKGYVVDCLNCYTSSPFFQDKESAINFWNKEIKKDEPNK